MNPYMQTGRFIVLFGVLLVVIGFIVMIAGKIPFMDRLPGDINLHGKGWSFHFPIVTSLVLSIILTVLLNLFLRR